MRQLHILFIIVVLGISIQISTIQLQALISNGKIIFASNRDGNYEIYTIESDGSNLLRLTNNSSIDLYPGWSPDGQKIVFTSDHDNTPGILDLYIMDADGSNPVKLITNPFDNEGQDMSPVWSPQDDRIAFTRQKLARLDIYTLNLDGTNLLNLTGARTENYNRMPGWSPDGSQIIFSASRFQTRAAPYDTESSIYAMNADGSDVTLLRSGILGFANPDISPDYAQIVFYDLSIPSYDLIIMNTDGNHLSSLTDDDFYDFDAVWSPDGGKIVFSSLRGTGTAPDIMIINSDGTDLLNLTNSENFSDIHPDWQPVDLSTETSTPAFTDSPRN